MASRHLSPNGPASGRTQARHLALVRPAQTEAHNVECADPRLARDTLAWIADRHEEALSRLPDNATAGEREDLAGHMRFYREQAGVPALRLASVAPVRPVARDLDAGVTYAWLTACIESAARRLSEPDDWRRWLLGDADMTRNMANLATIGAARAVKDAIEEALHWVPGDERLSAAR